MKIVFFGTPPFAARILEALLSSRHSVVAVVTQPDRPQGRKLQVQPPAVKQTLLEKGEKIPLFQPEVASTEEIASTLKKFSPDLFVVVAYGEIIKENLLSIPPYRCINVHPSLLPKYRGAAPLQRALMSGEEKTGVCIIEMVKKMDAGPILGKREISISDEQTGGELEAELCEVSISLLLDVIDRIENGKVKVELQDEGSVTFAPKIKAEDRHIDWERPARELHNQIRALSPYPGAYTEVWLGKEKKRLVILRAEMDTRQGRESKETLLWSKKEWVITCGDRSLSLKEVQLEGKKRMSIDEFIRGMGSPPKLT